MKNLNAKDAKGSKEEGVLNAEGAEGSEGGGSCGLCYRSLSLKISAPLPSATSVTSALKLSNPFAAFASFAFKILNAKGAMGSKGGMVLNAEGAGGSEGGGGCGSCYGPFSSQAGVPLPSATSVTSALKLSNPFAAFASFAFKTFRSNKTTARGRWPRDGCASQDRGSGPGGRQAARPFWPLGARAPAVALACWVPLPLAKGTKMFSLAGLLRAPRRAVMV